MTAEKVDFRFGKAYQLSSQKVIDQIFTQGRSKVFHPFLFKWISVSDEMETMQILFSVSKKKFKHAVQRNRVKRLMRESFRLEFGAYKMLNLPKSKICCVYLASEIQDLEQMRKQMRSFLLYINKTER